MSWICFVFFFSSRRRHTRCYRDWSSDVCSSDLPGGRYQDHCSAEDMKSLPGIIVVVCLLSAGEQEADRRKAKDEHGCSCRMNSSGECLAQRLLKGRASWG